jgi:hypothetical protein
MIALMKAAIAAETPVNFYQTTRRINLEADYVSDNGLIIMRTFL